MGAGVEVLNATATTPRVRDALMHLQRLTPAEMAELQRLPDEAIPAPTPDPEPELRFDFVRPGAYRVSPLGEKALEEPGRCGRPGWAASVP